MKSFEYFFRESEELAGEEPKRVANDIVTTFGRHNPPHLGHKLGFDRAHDLASNIGDDTQADQQFYTSRSQDPKKNPLPYTMKLDFLKKMFPDHAEKWDGDENVRTILGAATKAHDKGYKNFHFVGGSDRRQGMEDLLRRYNGNLYDFDNIYSHSAGERDGDDLLSQLSASKQRKFAADDDFDGFADGLPIGQNFGMDEAKRLFEAIKMYSQKNEDWEINPRENQEYIREIYRDGFYVDEGDIIESLTSGLIGTVHRCGTNHIIAITEDGVMFKNFVHDIHPL